MKAKIFAIMAPCGAPSILIPADDKPPGYPYLPGISVWCWHCRDFVDGQLALAHHTVPAAATEETPTARARDYGERLVDAWNARYPIGTLVRYWRGIRETEPSGTGPTRSDAWLLGGHTPVVLIEGTTGGIALTHVQVVEEPAPALRPGTVAHLRRNGAARTEEGL